MKNNNCLFFNSIYINNNFIKSKYMDKFKTSQNSPEHVHIQQKNQNNNSTNLLLMELVNNTKTNLENKINNIVSLLQRMKIENEQNLVKSKINNFKKYIFIYL